MIDILSFGQNKSRIRIHFTCDWCGCQFAADRANYFEKVCGYHRVNEGEWVEDYEYRLDCPVCGGPISVKENNVEKWEYTILDNGTEVKKRVN